MASCIQIEGMLQSYVDDEATASERLLIDEHLKTCGACVACLQTIKTTAAIAFEMLRQDQLREDMTDRVMAHLPDITPVFTDTASARYYALVKRRNVGRWLGAVARLMPIFTPIVLLILAMLLWIAWPSYTLNRDAALGMVMYCDGNAMTHASSGRTRPARIRDVIAQGDRFETSDKSRLLLGVEGSSIMTVFENTAVEVRAPRDIFLREGRVFFDVFHDTLRFHVYTPDGRITVLGTSFQVDIRDSGTEVTVVNGEVLLENESVFLRLHPNAQALVGASREPVVRQNVNTSAYVRAARSVRPDPVAERRFLSRLKHDSAGLQRPSEQVFVVEAAGRTVSALLLSWMPDPYTEGHAGYTVYVSDNSMTPLFKAFISPETFRDKAQSMVRFEMPPALCTREMDALHITIMSEKALGLVETTFTKVAAVGGAS